MISGLILIAKSGKKDGRAKQYKISANYARTIRRNLGESNQVLLEFAALVMEIRHSEYENEDLKDKYNNLEEVFILQRLV